MGCFFMTREIELSLAVRGSIKIHDETKTVEWMLPVSKTDPCGLGKVRAWGCTCQSDDDAELCPFHIMKEHCMFIDAKFCDNVHEQLPLLPGAPRLMRFG